MKKIKESATKNFEGKGINVKYFPEDKVIFLVPNGAQPHVINFVKNKLETMLSIQSTKQEHGGISIKLSDNSMVSPEELIRSMGFQGGYDVDDASSLAKSNSEEEIQKEKAQQLPNQVANSPANPQMPGQLPPEMNQMPQEATKFDVYNLLYEKFTFKKRSNSSKKKTSRKIGDYWKSLERSSGKNRNNINEKDVLSMRREYARKPNSKQRNETLRSLDKAARYFVNRLKLDKGERIATEWIKKYVAADNINPREYSENGSNEIAPIPNSDMMSNNVTPDLNSMFKDLQKDDEDENPGVDYEDIDVEDEDTIPQL